MRVLRFLLLVLLLRNISAAEEHTSFHIPTNTYEWNEQKVFFQKHGYLWIKNFFSQEQVTFLQDQAEEIHRGAQNLLLLTQNGGPSLKYLQQNIPGALIVVPELQNPSQACRAEDLLSCFPDLYEFITGSVTSYIGHLFEEPYVIFKDKINFKWPGGGAFTPHQDFPAYEIFGPRQHVTAMVSIDYATLENGCLQVAKNWQETFVGDLEAGLVIPYIEGGQSHGTIQPQYCEKISWLALETSPRDLVLISSFIPHYSEPNKSQNPRRALFLTHNRLEEGEFRKTYYRTKRDDPDNPIFHFATPTKARTK
ncbi:MAG TPA: phytanoyl-CoA dioxygenase family protein [Rhabdochlamydiaceae bacterium]|nr:phytanoyl-CoA dioxygenase family protein [Rhabdochlamydiaceae bacterium]